MDYWKQYIRSAATTIKDICQTSIRFQNTQNTSCRLMLKRFVERHADICDSVESGDWRQILSPEISGKSHINIKQLVEFFRCQSHGLLYSPAHTKKTVVNFLFICFCKAQVEPKLSSIIHKFGKNSMRRTWTQIDERYARLASTFIYLLSSRSKKD